MPSEPTLPGVDVATQTPEFGPQMPLSEKLLAIAIRAQNFTGASGVAVAIKEGEAVVCRASWGTSAPDVGTPLQGEQSFTSQCLRAGKALRCDDAATDPRVNAAACEALGISAIAAAPVHSSHDVVGVLVAFSETPHAFHDSHMMILETLAEVIGTFLRDESAAAKSAPVRTAAVMPQPVVPKPSLEPLPAAPLPGLSPNQPDPLPPAPAFSSVKAPEPLPVVLEKEPELRMDERHAHEFARDPGLQAAADHIVPAPVKREEPPARSAAKMAAANRAAAVPFEKPAKPRDAAPQSQAPDFSFSVEEEKRGFRLPVIDFSALAAKLRFDFSRLPFDFSALTQNRMVVLPAAGVLVLLIALLGFGLHHKSSPKPAAAEAAAPAQTTEEADSNVSPAPAALTASAPPTGSVMSASVRASERPSAAKREAEPEPEPEPVITSTSEPIRQPSAVPAVSPDPQAPPSLALASSALPQLPPMPGASATIASATPARLSQSVPNQLVRKVAPIFPAAAKQYRLRGTVVLTAKVRKDGSVADVKVVSGPSMFQQAAVDAVRQWRYKPASLDGQPVESIAEITLNFSPN